MQAVSLSGHRRIEFIEVPRPALRDPGDAIVLVTTAAIGPWDIERFLSTSEEPVIPGGEFAGLVVEIGEAVSTIELDDLVANTVNHSDGGVQSDLFGSSRLPGGHAEYVRVPNADQTLFKIAASGEERSVIAGGTVGMGLNAATSALAVASGSTYAVVGCDPIGMTALTALKNAGVSDRLIAVENHSARRTLASSFASEALQVSDIRESHRSDLVIIGSINESPGFDAVLNLINPGGGVIFSEPYGPAMAIQAGIKFPKGITVSTSGWPTSAEAAKTVIDLQIRKLDLTPHVSHVIPLEEAQEAYEAASEPAPGVQKVLLKP